MRIIVASLNPVKIQAVQAGFNQIFPNLKAVFEGVNVPSEVPNQPISDKETFNGALNRANNARNLIPEADYWVGLEGGLIDHSSTEMEVMAWIVVLDKTRMGKSRTASIDLPLDSIKLVREGMELGHADEIVHKVSNSKQNMGTTGLLTNNAVNREAYYVQSVIFAFIPFLKTELYK